MCCVCSVCACVLYVCCIMSKQGMCSNIHTVNIVSSGDEIASPALVVVWRSLPPARLRDRYETQRQSPGGHQDRWVGM